jgi:hypothetical protein
MPFLKNIKVVHYLRNVFVLGTDNWKFQYLPFDVNNQGTYKPKEEFEELFRENKSLFSTYRRAFLRLSKALQLKF